MDDYKQRRYNRRKRFSRILLGIQQLIQYPIINVLWFILIAGITVLIYGENKLMLLYDGQAILKQIILIVLRIVNVVVTIVFVLGMIYFIGEMTARRDEADLCLVFGDKRDIVYYPPILMKKKFDKKRQITQREFYTSIPMERWGEKREALCDRLDIHLIGDLCIEGSDCYR